MSTTVTVIEFAKVEQINAAYRAAQCAYGDALSHAWDCGRMLSAVKADVGHGRWLPWLEENFEGSERTAQVYMQLAAAEPSNPQASADLSIAAVLKQIGKPRPEPKVDVAGALRTLGPESSQRLDDARDRLQSEASITFSVQQQRKRHRAIEQLDEARHKLDQAASAQLSAFGVAESVRAAALQARHAASTLDELAFSFER